MTIHKGGQRLKDLTETENPTVKILTTFSVVQLRRLNKFAEFRGLYRTEVVRDAVSTLLDDFAAAHNVCPNCFEHRASERDHVCTI